MVCIKKLLTLFVLQLICDEVLLLIYGFTFNNNSYLTYVKYDNNNKIAKRHYIPYEEVKKTYRKDYFILYSTPKIQEDNNRNDINDLLYDVGNINENKNSISDEIDIFNEDGLQLKQWYSAEKVKEKWREKHIENVRSNYEKVLLNNKYNEMFNMYRNIKNNNVENAKKRVKTNRINPVIYVKKRLVSATAKYIKMSFIKTRKILWKIRYMPIIKAFAFLYYYGSNIYTVNIYKCIKSCLHNAINKYGKNNIKPVFHTLQANMGGYTKKINIRAKGKTDIIREPHTHIRVVLEV
ncbi:50S ribosomal protein L22, apicoplast, putative [Plasmodium malariae]|uniref:50S ribosomal protein L22, apicoplast, putative n=1 Tax=Plasmodium malariae TaxID=5858 RepID=A0A1C3L152_PLAMA|nr:50S ribosomal protein L22, apicoplast, putative [Plasmodium malariae]